MKDKNTKDTNFFSTEGLIFTKEDREQVFARLREIEKNSDEKHSLIYSKIVPLMVSLITVGLCIFTILI